MAYLVRRMGYITGRAIRETGQALDRLGCRLQGNYAFREQLSRHRRIMPLYEKQPAVDNKVTFIAPSASVIGEVAIGEKSSVWYGAVLRGDVNFIKVGKNTVIGDRVVVQSTRVLQKRLENPTLIGDNVVVAQGASLSGCTIEDNAMVDIGATVLDGAVVSHTSILGPGSLLMEGTRIPPGELWAGSPAQFVKKLTPEEIESIRGVTQKYQDLAARHDEWHALTEKEREMERMKKLDTDYMPEYIPERRL